MTGIELPSVASTTSPKISYSKKRKSLSLEWLALQQAHLIEQLKRARQEAELGRHKAIEFAQVEQARQVAELASFEQRQQKEEFKPWLRMPAKRQPLPASPPLRPKPAARRSIAQSTIL